MDRDVAIAPCGRAVGQGRTLAEMNAPDQGPRARGCHENTDRAQCRRARGGRARSARPASCYESPALPHSYGPGLPGASETPSGRAAHYDG